MSRPIEIRTVADLERTARSLALHFKARTVVVVGSQGILVGWPGAPVTMCMSPEIDAYPANCQHRDKNGPGTGLKRGQLG